MKYYPVFLDLKGKKVTVIGGGSVAERKVLTLLKAGAKVRLISPEITERLRMLSTQNKIKHIARKYKKCDCDNLFMVVIATDDKKTNTAIADVAEKKNCLINVVDSPDESNFIAPSIVTKGDLQIAISTGGKSPALAKRIRKDMQGIFGKEYEGFISMLGEIRKRLLKEESSEEKRRKIFNRLADSEILDLLRDGEIMKAKEKVNEISGIEL